MNRLRRTAIAASAAIAMFFIGIAPASATYGSYGSCYLNGSHIVNAAPEFRDLSPNRLLDGYEFYTSPNVVITQVDLQGVNSDTGASLGLAHTNPNTTYGSRAGLYVWYKPYAAGRAIAFFTLHSSLGTCSFNVYF